MDFAEVVFVGEFGGGEFCYCIDFRDFGTHFHDVDVSEDAIFESPSERLGFGFGYVVGFVPSVASAIGFIDFEIERVGFLPFSIEESFVEFDIRVRRTRRHRHDDGRDCEDCD